MRVCTWLFQDELLDSNSVTPMSTTASEPGLDCQREDGDGSSRCAEVQAAPGTRSISTGESVSQGLVLASNTQPELHFEIVRSFENRDDA